MRDDSLEREILRPLWKVHILHHAQEREIVGHWMLEELREHGYRVSPGTLYPMLARMVKLGWLERVRGAPRGAAHHGRPFRATAAGRQALSEVEARLRELIGEVSAPPPSKPVRKRS